MSFVLDYGVVTVKVRVNEDPRLQRGRFPVTRDARWGLDDGWQVGSSRRGRLKSLGLNRGTQSELEKVRTRRRVSHYPLMS